MQNNRKCSSRRVVLPQKNVRDTSSVAPFGGVSPFGSNLSQPMHGVQFQPSEICPRNYIIFDHTQDRDHVMYHPALAPNLSNPPVEFNQSPMGENVWNFRNNVNRDHRSSFSEESDDINALLSLDGDGQDHESNDDDDDDAISTARTQGYDGSSSPDSCTNYAPKSRRVECSSSHRSSFGGNRGNEGKRKKLRKMVKVLQGMVPGGDQMNTADVLDEAVKYLKSMKVEAKNLGPE